MYITHQHNIPMSTCQNIHGSISQRSPRSQPPARLNVNCFRIIWNPSSSIYHYHYDLSGEAAANAATDPKAEQRG